MKIVFKVYLLLFLTLCAIILSCREEEMEVIGIPEEETLISTSTVSSLIQRTVMHDGSKDNIIDQSNCFTIKLPINVEINNGENILVDSEETFNTIEATFDLYDEDEDIINITYPITIILADYSEVIIHNITELNTYSNACHGENEEDIDIECVDFNYPIIAKIFNTNEETLKTISLQNDKELYDFITHIDDFDVVSVYFPIFLTLYDGTESEINSLVDLERVIMNDIYACDEDDDNNYNDDDCNDCTVEDLSHILVNCTNWTVNNLERNKNEDYYVSYKFNFLADGSMTAVNPIWNHTGTWSASGEGNNIVVHINVPNLPECNNDWILHELKLASGEVEFDLNLNNEKLRYESGCFSGMLNDTFLIETLIGGDWVVGNYFNDTDQTLVFSDYVISFSANGIITSTSSSGTNTGHWNTATGNSYDVELNLNFRNTYNLRELTEDWDVVEVTSTTIQLRDISREDGTEDTLTLERL